MVRDRPQRDLAGRALSHPANTDPERLPVIVRGARTAFVESGGAFGSLMSYELGARAIEGLVEKTALDNERIDMVALGTIVHEVRTSNVARDAMLQAGLPRTTPGYTVSMAGLSPIIAITGLCDMIACGRIDTGIAGGTESFSDMPVRLSQNLRRALFKLYQGGASSQWLSVLGSLRPKDLLLDLPSAADLATGQTMGDLCEAMARHFEVTREASDHFAADSHRKAIEAWQSGRYDADIVPVHDARSAPVTRDNSPREDALMEKLRQLRPVFDKKSGVITAGNASRFTDGAAAVLLSSLATARKLGLEPQVVLRDYVFAGVADLETEALCGPAMTIPRLLHRNGLGIDDIDAWELHEAFAAQILVNQVCLGSDAFARTRLGLERAPGEIPVERLNAWGGSLALGNPFSATGVRLIMTAARRIMDQGDRYAIVSSCAGGGLGAAVLLENATYV
jgi:acetyl-CoA acyltransferase